MIYATVA